MLSTIFRPLALVLAWSMTAAAFAADVAVDLSGFRGANAPEPAIVVRHDGEQLDVSWQSASADISARLSFDLRPGSPLIKSIGMIAGSPDATSKSVATGLDPVFFVTVGSRVNPPGRPPGMSDFNVFFDNPATRPYKNYPSKLDLRTVKVTGGPERATVSIGDLSAGPFSGAIRFTVYAGMTMFRIEAAMSTKEEKRAYLYDVGLVSRNPVWKSVVWRDTEGVLHNEPFAADSPDKAIAVRHRAIAVETPQGSLACFPPPHQFFFPRDYTDNQKTVWIGKGHRQSEDRPGFGVRQTETGGGNYVPWFDAPPGTEQHMGVFFMVESGSGKDLLEDVLKLTRGDRYKDLPGYTTFTSHWHMAITMAALKEKAEKKKRTTPDFVKMFKDMNVRVVHLAEFHGDGHPGDPGPIRLAEMAAMFEECKRLSDDRLTLLPGEEANVYLRVNQKEANAGHWLYLFPKPIFWTMKRGPNQPFVEEDAKYGEVYHVGNETDMTRLIEVSGGLVWTAHPRIKASNWAPDAYRDRPYFQSNQWLGGAWKAMPADLSEPRLGLRVLNLLDDMANWQPGKYVPGEVDVFKIDHTHELYGHMNVNYLMLGPVRELEKDWSPVIQALRLGRFFVTTGEVLLKHFGVGIEGSGGTYLLPPDGNAVFYIALEWTFPMNFAEIISGDGEKIYRERIDLSNTRAYGEKRLSLRSNLKGRKWVRVEAWDVAANGTFSQPIWLTEAR